MQLRFTPLFCSATLLLASSLTQSSDAFVPSKIARSKISSTSSLGVSVVGEILLNKDEAEKKVFDAFETQTPESVGMTGSDMATKTKTEKTSTKSSVNKRKRQNRKHNFQKNRAFLKEEPDLDFYTLHSSAVSHLHKDMPINDIIRAVKRAQNRHDAHDLATIAAFLIEECDETWGYGFRGSLLSRLAVAALHMDEVDVAMRAIETRRLNERASMKPHESAAIVRGLMRNHLIFEGWMVLEDELALPDASSDMTSEENVELIKFRSQSLASIASRHLFEGEPYVAAQALSRLGELGDLVYESRVMEQEGMEMPWTRLVRAAAECNKKLSSMSFQIFVYTDKSIELPEDMTELVWDAMANFHCPDDTEGCPLEDFFDSEY